MTLSTPQAGVPPRATGAGARIAPKTLDSAELGLIDAYWRAANYLSVGQIYLYDNPLLREPLTLAHVKPMVVGHWGTTPGQNFIYVHLNRVIRSHELEMIYIAGPGHGGPTLIAACIIGDALKMHILMATILEKAIEEIRACQHHARTSGDSSRPRWPMIVLRSPKGGTGPKRVDGLQIEGTFRAHQVPLAVDHRHPDHVALLESWMKSYRPEELFDAEGRLDESLAALAPTGDLRMGASPYANGGILLRDLRMPDFRRHAVTVPSPGAVEAQDTFVLGKFLRDVLELNAEPRNFRVFGPDETLSNLLGSVFDVTNRQWDAEHLDNDEFLAPAGGVLDSMLSEHQCEGWLEGYLLTGRHGLFNSYEAFIRIVDSMFSQHAKWLKVTLELPWRRAISSLNYLLASHVWQQDHNGFTHQDPGFLDHVINKKADIVRVYLPPDANCRLSTIDHCLRSRNYVNVVVAGKHPLPQWLTMEEAIIHCSEGIGIWQWTSVR
jgi:xylulose-5-phosphate/fructose-6-phosphate phosphoketolase